MAGRKWCYYFVLSLYRGRQAVTFQPGPQANCRNDGKMSEFKGKKKCLKVSDSCHFAYFLLFAVIGTKL